MKPAATAAIPSPSGFSWAMPAAWRAPCFISPPSGVAPATFERTEPDLVGDGLLRPPAHVGLVAERLDGVTHPLACLLYVLPDLARVLAHSMSSFTLSLACSGTGGTAS